MTAFEDREWPQSLAMEQAVIGAAILDNNALKEARSILQPEDFFRIVHRTIYETMLTIQDRAEAFNESTLVEELRKLPSSRQAIDPTVNFSDEISAPLYLANCMDACTSPVLVGVFAKEVREKSICRELILRANEVADLAQYGNLSELAKKNGNYNLSALIASSPSARNPFTLGAISAANLPEATDPERIWLGLYPGTVTLLVGETSAGKSSLLYNIAIHAARNEPLWNIPFGAGRPLRVFYIDPENAGNYKEGQGGLCARKIERIGQGRPKDLLFHPGRGVNLSEPSHVHALREFVEREKIDLLILDPIANIFQTKDENDNAEAAKQMATLLDMSRETNVCVVAVHHTGKNNTGDYGRGASARLASADIGLAFRVRGEEGERDDTFQGELQPRDDALRLQIAKNRLEGKASLYLKMVGLDRFELATFADWKAAGRNVPAGKKQSEAQEEIYHFLLDGEEHLRINIVEAMAKEGIGKDATDAALKQLVTEKVLTSRRGNRGGSLFYKLVSGTEEASTPEPPLAPEDDPLDFSS